jgi:hypothetical protein
VLYLQLLRSKPVLWISIGFNADTDPAFLVNEDPDADVDLDPGF